MRAAHSAVSPHLWSTPRSRRPIPNDIISPSLPSPWSHSLRLLIICALCSCRRELVNDVAPPVDFLFFSLSLLILTQGCPSPRTICLAESRNVFPPSLSHRPIPWPIFVVCPPLSAVSHESVSVLSAPPPCASLALHLKVLLCLFVYCDSSFPDLLLFFSLS